MNEKHKNQLKQIWHNYGTIVVIQTLLDVMKESAPEYAKDAIVHSYIPIVEESKLKLQEKQLRRIMDGE